MKSLRASRGMRGITAVGAIIAVAIGLAACGDGLPSRPDEARFRASSESERCRLTASRAILCTDELMVEELRSMSGVEDPFVEEIDRQLADHKRLPKHERKENIELHKARCAADVHYPADVLRCWATAGCKEFAACVHARPPAKSTTPSSRAADDAAPARSAAPAGSAPPAGGAAPAGIAAPAGSAAAPGSAVPLP